MVGTSLYKIFAHLRTIDVRLLTGPSRPGTPLVTEECVPKASAFCNLFASPASLSALAASELPPQAQTSISDGVAAEKVRC